MNDFGLLIAQYNSVLPTLADGQLSELQVDASGRLLVQADVSVVIDFLGLNGAGDSSNILVVGTEDGTSGGTARVLRLTANGSTVIDDGGSSITVDATDLDIRDLTSATDSIEVLQDTHDDLNANANIQVGNVDVGNANPVPVSDAGGSLTVDATDFDIRDLSAAQDNIAISDGTETLAINVDGSINVGNTVTVSATDLDIRDISAAQDNIAISDGTDTLAINADGSINTQTELAAPGAEEFASADSAGDGIAAITTAFSNLVTIAVGAGETLYIYGYQFDADVNSFCRLIVDDNGTPSNFLKVRQTTSAMPGVSEHFSNEGRIEIAGAANRSVILQARGKTESGNAAASIHSRKLT